jgi:threonine dehydrogenase-like Zn-dependent dehydrogenase
MRNLQFQDGGCALIEVPAPSPRPGQVLIRLKGTLVDETHLQDFRGGVQQAPFLVCGEVLQPGAGVIGLRRGQAVLTVCTQPLGTYLLVSVDQVLPVSQNRAASCLLLGIALALQAVPAAEEYPESTVIGGAGFIGLALCALLETTTPWVFGSSDAALVCAKDLGASHGKEWPQALEELAEQSVEERGFGAVLIETTGRLQNRLWAETLTLKGGTIVMATPTGPGGDPLEIDATRLHYDQITWRALGPLDAQGIAVAQEHLERIPDSLVSDCLPFSQIEKAFQLLDAERGVCYLMSNDSDF